MELVAQVLVFVCALINVFGVGMYCGIEKGYNIAKAKKENE